jgi:hypothetical protein
VWGGTGGFKQRGISSERGTGNRSGDQDTRHCASAAAVPTFDKDFGDVALVHGLSSCGSVDLVSLPARKQANLCLPVLNLHGSELAKLTYRVGPTCEFDDPTPHSQLRPAAQRASLLETRPENDVLPPFR